MPILASGPRVRLRTWQPHDLPVLERWMQPGHAWKQTDGPYYPLMSDKTLQRWLDHLRARVDSPGDAPRDIVVALEGTLVGRVSASWISKETDWSSVGITLYDDSIWGRGLGYEALGLWTELLLSRGHPRLDLRTWDGHHGMMRLAEKLGYKLEARFRRARVVQGKRCDGLAYGVLPEEWRARYPSGFGAHLRNLDGVRST